MVPRRPPTNPLDREARRGAVCRPLDERRAEVVWVTDGGVGRLVSIDAVTAGRLARATSQELRLLGVGL